MPVEHILQPGHAHAKEFEFGLDVIPDARHVAKRFNVSTVAAHDPLERLSGRGVLAEPPLRKGRRGRTAKVFEATELFNLLDEDRHVLASRRTKGD